MKRLITYALSCFSILLLSLSCSQAEVTAPGTEGGTGSLALRITGTRADDGTYNPFDYLAVRIFNGQGDLVRKYTSMESIPASLELLSGDYRITVEAGDRSAATFTNKSYYGESAFTITPGTTCNAEVVCKLINTAAQVKFDATIAANFGANFKAQVCASDKYDASAAASGVPTLEYRSDKTGYFILPQGESNLSWEFRGTHPKHGEVVKTGVFENVEPGNRYTVILRYSPDLPGYIDLTLSVDTSTDDWDDTIIFSPDPTITGADFNPNEIQKYISGEKTFRFASLGVLESIDFEFAGVSYKAFDYLEGAPATAATRSDAGIVTRRTDDYNATVTFSDAFFTGKPGGNTPLRFQIKDADGGSLNAETVFRLQGLTAVTSADQDLWNNTVTLYALVFDPSISTVTFSLRKAGGEWTEAVGTRKGDLETFSATFATEWSESTNKAGLTVYTPNPDKGVFANNNYEYKVAFDTKPAGEYVFTTAAGDLISNAGMEDWSSYNVTGSVATGGSVPYPNANSSTQFWVGGNNKTTNTLCVGATPVGCNGVTCAKLQPVEAAGIFAAGNLFTGTFSCGTGLLDMFGFAAFGIKHNFTMRPRGLKIHYNATITTVTNTGGSSLTTNDLDSARIFVCITDWTSRHTVKSGKTYDENTFWNPAKTTSLAEGAILGYGMITRGESTGGWVTEVIPINWYDTQAKPREGNYSYSISCATSAYGDYVAGSTNNLLYVEDFEWVY